MSRFDEYYNAIDEIKDFLYRDLIGPVEDDEVIKSVEPLNYYAMGILWPKRLWRGGFDYARFGGDFRDSNDSSDSSDSNDSIADANSYKPCAMGVSVMLPAGVKRLSGSFSFGKYEMSIMEEKIPYYTRRAFVLTPTFAVPSRLGTARCKQDSEYRKLGADISLCVRKVMEDGSKLVTVSVVNAAFAPQQSREQNENALFQCKLSVDCPEGFLPVYRNAFAPEDLEEQVSAMQYRDVRNFAYGHGCSVSYGGDCGSGDESGDMSGDTGSITCINSEFMPVERVLQMMPGSIKEERILRLAYWREAERAAACDELDGFIDEYAAWRAEQAAKSERIGGEFRNAAGHVLSNIDTCISRLRHGVRVLRKDDDAWSAFKLMNRAMLLQRTKTKKLKAAQAQNVMWYPFQMAYILQIIPDITQRDSAFRESVDLLWFPTGGGKTEAYLGVAAFVIFYRRFSNNAPDDGVTVLMRYTLRLLTIQQFERAAALICACESLRSALGIPGGKISIGLWIGGSMTPNRIDGPAGAADILRELNKNPDKKCHEGNPIQITTCPWCGEAIDIGGYSIENGAGMNIRCNRNPKCAFHSSLPIYLVDDDIYRVKPTLVLSTIDKFARLAWEERSKSLFGSEKIAPPELIIQDELHLISGPLGSLAGIYEIGVEFLCDNNGRYPKVIASTATVKDAKAQIKNLYNKPSLQFPTGGMDFTDSFFSKRANEKRRAARTYIGLCETGGTLADLMIRVYASLVFVKHLFIKQGKPEGVVDQFSTIIGYFNAIRDLGSAGNIIFDRVYSVIRMLTNLKFKADAEKAGLTLQDIKAGNNDEFPSRKTSKEVKETLTKLEIPYTANGSYSYVLASNMLSVGIDINRLGIMTMYNQPKSNAEYIQATSRVGRQNPGVVLTLYNAARSRDKSHYEQFGFYHRSFYKYVESTSVTPFSARAIEKAVHCVFIIMLRLSVPKLSANESAANFKADSPYVQRAANFIIERVCGINPDAVIRAKEYIEYISNKWEELARDNPETLVYYRRNKEGVCNLLVNGEQDAILDFPATLNSLRNVEPSSNVFIQERY